jgi:hypothetical protein
MVLTAEQKKKVRIVLVGTRMVARRPIRKGLWAQWDNLSYLATTMTLLRSPILIPEIHTESKTIGLRSGKRRSKAVETCCFACEGLEVTHFRNRLCISPLITYVTLVTLFQFFRVAEVLILFITEVHFKGKLSKLLTPLCKPLQIWGYDIAKSSFHALNHNCVPDLPICALTYIW